MAVELLTVLTPVIPGREADLEQTLNDLPPGPDSPFVEVDGTHVARWVVLDRLGFGPRLRPPLLVFTAVFDGPLQEWLKGLWAGLDKTADDVWCHCARWPGAGDAAALSRWLLEHRVRHGVPFVAYRHAKVDDIEEGLALRRHLGEFAVRSQGLAPEALRQSWREEFGW